MTTTLDRIDNLVPHLSTAADMADEHGRDGDAALFAAAVVLFRAIAAALEQLEEKPDVVVPIGPAHHRPAGVVQELAAKGILKPEPDSKHRHVYDAVGVCSCGRKHKPRAAQNANGREVPGATPAAPIVEGTGQ